MEEEEAKPSMGVKLQIKELQEEVEENVPQEEVEIKVEPQTEMEIEEQQEGTEESEEEEVKRPVAVYLPVKVELEDEEEDEAEEDSFMSYGEDVSHQEWSSTSSVTYKIKMSPDVEEFKKKFDEAFLKLFLSKRDNSAYISSSRYAELIQEVKRAKEEKKKSTISYRRLKRYDILNIDGDEKLIVPLSEGETTFRYFVANENLFHVLHEAHISLGHGGKHRMIMKIKKKYANVTQEAILLFLKFCVSCQEKRASSRKVVEKPMVASERNSRCQVDLIDMQAQADGDYHFILVYQDLLTKFVQLRALISKRAEEVAEHLLNIFCIFGAPSVLQYNNEGEFPNQIIESLKKTWNSLTIVLGKPCHNQNQGSVEQANQDIQNMLVTWMKMEGVSAWSQGLKFIQLMKNNSYHDDIKRTPYQAMFGHDMKVGLSSSALPSDVVQKLKTEDELEEILNELPKKHNVSTNLSEHLNKHSIETLKENDVHAVRSEQLSHQPENVREKVCGVCDEPSSDDFTVCNSCKTFIHTSCGIGNAHKEESDSFGVMCPLCRKKKCIGNNQNKTKESLIVQAEKMKSSSTRSIP